MIIVLFAKTVRGGVFYLGGMWHGAIRIAKSNYNQF